MGGDTVSQFKWWCWFLVLMLPPVIPPPQAWAEPVRLITEQSPGWGPWQPPEQTQAAEFDAGFSNSELGGYMDMQNSCGQLQNRPMDEVVFWFRLHHLVKYLGTGWVEFGCVVGEQIRLASRISAIDRNQNYVSCWEITQAEPLPVYAEFGQWTRPIHHLRPGATVDPGWYPATLVFIDDQPNSSIWAHISKPVNGWIEFGSMDTNGNFQRCPGPS